MNSTFKFRFRPIFNLSSDLFLWFVAVLAGVAGLRNYSDLRDWRALRQFQNRVYRFRRLSTEDSHQFGLRNFLQPLITLPLLDLVLRWRGEQRRRFGRNKATRLEEIHLSDSGTS